METYTLNFFLSFYIYKDYTLNFIYRRCMTHFHLTLVVIVRVSEAQTSWVKKS